MTALTSTDDDAFATTGEVPAAGPQAKRRSLRDRVVSGELDIRSTWQVVAGAILVPLGVAVILLGWAGAAHGRVDQQQIPYLISGGILGLAAVILGGFFFWAHWLYRIYDQADLHHQQAMHEQSELLQTLVEAVKGMSDGHVTDAGSANGATAGYVATPTGSNYHSPGCPVVANRRSSLRNVSTEEAATMRPCRICEPNGAGES